MKVPSKKELERKKKNLSESDSLKFSFQLYECHPRHCLSRFDQDEVRKTMQDLQELCQVSMSDLRHDPRNFHFHPIDWAKTMEPDGFSDPALEDAEIFQASLNRVAGGSGRIFGAIYGDTFYIVWFDKDHAVTGKNQKRGKGHLANKR